MACKQGESSLGLLGAAPEAARKARLAMRSSREWKVMTARRPPGLSSRMARGMASVSASSSPFTAMRRACDRHWLTVHSEPVSQAQEVVRNSTTASTGRQGALLWRSAPAAVAMDDDHRQYTFTGQEVLLNDSHWWFGTNTLLLAEPMLVLTEEALRGLCCMATQAGSLPVDRGAACCGNFVCAR